MGYVEILYKDGSGILVANDEISEVKWAYCDQCRTIATEGMQNANFDVFICNECLSHESA